MLRGWGGGEAGATPGGRHPHPPAAPPHQLPLGAPEVQVEVPDAIVRRHLQPLVGVAEEDAAARLLPADGEAALVVDGELHLLPAQRAACGHRQGSAPPEPRCTRASPRGSRLPPPPALTHRHLLDQLGGGVAALHEDARPGGEVPVGLHAEDVHLHALARARPGGEGELRAQGGRAAARARVDQPGGWARTGWASGARWQRQHHPTPCPSASRGLPPAPAGGKDMSGGAGCGRGGPAPGARRRMDPAPRSPPGSHQRVAVARGGPGVPGPGHAVVQQQVLLRHRHEDRPPLLPPSVQAHLEEAVRGTGGAAGTLPPAPTSRLTPTRRAPRCRALGSIPESRARSSPRGIPLLGPSSPQCPGRLRRSGSELVEDQGGGGMSGSSRETQQDWEAPPSLGHSQAGGGALRQLQPQPGRRCHPWGRCQAAPVPGAASRAQHVPARPARRCASPPCRRPRRRRCPAWR